MKAHDKKTAKLHLAMPESSIRDTVKKAFEEPGAQRKEGSAPMGGVEPDYLEDA